MKLFKNVYKNIRTTLDQANKDFTPTADPRYVEAGSGQYYRHFNTRLGPLNVITTRKELPNTGYNNSPQPSLNLNYNAAGWNPPSSQSSPTPLPSYTPTPRPTSSMTPTALPTPMQRTTPSPIPLYTNTPRPLATPKVDATKFLTALGQRESSGNYNARNKTSGAIGKYQIMPSNWGPWAQEAGLAPTAPTTSANQEKIAQFQINKLYNKYGNWGDVASVWYSGQPLSRAKLNQSQGAYPTIKSYVNSVLSRVGL